MASAFGSAMTDESRAGWERIIELPRMLEESRAAVAVEQRPEGDAVVGTSAWLPFDMTVPGGELPVAAVTMVTVRPTHRRRGILRQLMQQELHDFHARGIAAATLWASESVIYQRFGYGMAFVKSRIEIDPRRAVFLGDTGPYGKTRLIGHDEALELLPPIYERVRPSLPASFRRSCHWWDLRTLDDAPWVRHGGSPMFRVVLTIDGQAEGYALYRITPGWGPDGLSTGTLDVLEALGTTPTATREVWRYLFGVDLVSQVRSWRICLGHPLFLALADPRQLRMSIGDGTWIRIVDAVRALEARRYGVEGSLTFDLVDPLCPWNAGVWTLEAGPDGASLRRGTAAPELRLSAAELSAMYLGTTACTSLARAGRLDALTPGAASSADGLFRSDTAPWCLDDF